MVYSVLLALNGTRLALLLVHSDITDIPLIVDLNMCRYVLFVCLFVVFVLQYQGRFGRRALSTARIIFSLLHSARQ